MLPFRNRLAFLASNGEGFTLLEVLVAFAILSLSLAVIFSMVGSGVTSARRAEDYTVAELLAESQLAKVGIEEPLTTGSEEGEYLSLYRWHTVIRPLQDVNRSEVLTAALPVYEVTVMVEWSDGAERGSVTLRSERVGEQ